MLLTACDGWDGSRQSGCWDCGCGKTLGSALRLFFGCKSHLDSPMEVQEVKWGAMHLHEAVERGACVLTCCLHGPGVLLCDTYLTARELVRQDDYTLATLARELLQEQRCDLSSGDVPGALLLMGQGRVRSAGANMLGSSMRSAWPGFPATHHRVCGTKQQELSACLFSA